MKSLSHEIDFTRLVEAMITDALFDLGRYVFDKMVAIARSASSKEVEDLDNAEKLAIAAIAGAPVEIVTSREDHRLVVLKMRTAVPVGIAKIDGKFHVAIAPKPFTR